MPGRRIASLATFATAAMTALALALGASAEEPDSEKQEAAASSREVAAASSPYQLPEVGKPTGRIGGGRRGAGGELPRVHALVPDHVGYTTSRQPVLYWYLSEEAKGSVHFELTLIDDESVEPLLDRRFQSPPTPGLNAVRLSEHGVELEPGEEYEWAVSLVPDPDDRSKDVVSSGWIQVVPRPEGLEDQLDAAGPDGAAAVYGASGLWYDTLEAVVSEVERHPGDPKRRSQLTGLLAQAGLDADAAAATP